MSKSIQRLPKTSITTFLSSAEIIPEPLDVVLVISTWNYPFYFPVLSLDLVIGAIAAGNDVVQKPSEFATASSSLLAKLLGKYLDNASIRIVEGQWMKLLHCCNKTGTKFSIHVCVFC